MHGPGRGAVGDQQVGDAGAVQRGERQRAHRAGADDQRRAGRRAGSPPEAEVERRADHALPGPVDAGLGVHPLADPQRLLDQLVQQPAGGAVLGGGAYASRNWPRIWLSPTTIESRPAATR